VEGTGATAKLPARAPRGHSYDFRWRLTHRDGEVASLEDVRAGALVGVFAPAP
jgi:hypothetical protein